MSTQLRPPTAARPNPSARTRSAIIDRLSPEDIDMFWDQIATSLPLVEETGAGAADDEVISRSAGAMTRPKRCFSSPTG